MASSENVIDLYRAAFDSAMGRFLRRIDIRMFYWPQMPRSDVPIVSSNTFVCSGVRSLCTNLEYGLVW